MTRYFLENWFFSFYNLKEKLHVRSIVIETYRQKKKGLTCKNRWNMLLTLKVFGICKIVKLALLPVVCFSRFDLENKRNQSIEDLFFCWIGTAIVLENKAALWTDGRYYLAAENELDCNWILMKSGGYNYCQIPS